VTNLSISPLLNATAINKDSIASDELRHTTLSFIKMTFTCLSVVLEFCILQPKTMADAIRKRHIWDKLDMLKVSQ